MAKLNFKIYQNNIFSYVETKVNKDVITNDKSFILTKTTPFKALLLLKLRSYLLKTEIAQDCKIAEPYIARLNGPFRYQT